MPNPELNTNHPFPKLNIHNQSGLSFPWAEYQPNVASISEFRAGSDGVAASMIMLIYWQDLLTAFQQILGFSYRDPNTTPPTLRRVLPWQHPFLVNLWAKSIVKVQGIRNEGTNITNLEDFFQRTGYQVGSGSQINYGPWSEFRLAALTIQFWRPPYPIRTDQDVFNPNTGRQMEWLRWVDRNWQIESQMLVRESGQMGWVGDPGAAPGVVPGTPPNQSFPGIWWPEISSSVLTTGTYFQGGLGQKIVHTKVKRTWYEVPEQAIFQPLAIDAAPNGLPFNLLYTQTPCANPITLGAINPPLTTPQIDNPVGNPITGCVNSPIGGGSDDSNPANRFFGCFAGILMLEAVEIRPRPLQIPAYLMGIPPFNSTDPNAPGERVSQQQLDIIFHFDMFDPPRSFKSIKNNQPRGHNTAPWAGDGKWYPVASKDQVSGSSIYSTPFLYADFTDLFTIL